MTSFLIAWSGLIVPLMGSIGMVAWKFPKVYNHKIFPILLFALWTCFISAIIWNVGLYHSRSKITEVPELVAEKIESVDILLRYRDLSFDDENYEAKLAEFNQEEAELRRKQHRWEGARDSIEKGRESIEAQLIGYFEFYWFLALFIYATLLSNIRKWFEEKEAKLAEESETIDAKARDSGSPNNQNQPDA